MKTIKSNFIKDEDYLIRTEKAAFPNGKAGLSTKNLGGAGLNKEDVMLNVDTFKNLCMVAKTAKGKEIRKYYVQLENIHNKIIKQEIEQQKRLLQEKDYKTALFNTEKRKTKGDLIKKM